MLSEAWIDITEYLSLLRWPKVTNPRRSETRSATCSCGRGGQTMIIILMGVTGSGKTTIGRLLAAELGWNYYDADDFHSPANLKKMASGIPLDDADRKPWLETLRNLIRDCLERGKN